MTKAIVELATIKLAEGKTEVDLIAASDTFQQNFLNEQTGFVRRELVRKSSGDFIDIVHWRSREDADAAMQKAETHTACHAFFAVMDFDAEYPEEGVEHYQSLAVYSSL